MHKSKGIGLLFFILFGYLFAAGFWWSYLLYIKNEDALRAKKALLWYEMQASGISNEQIYLDSEGYKNLIYKYSRQELMIFLEGIVLVGSMLIGLWRIYKSIQKEIRVNQQQQNFLLSITHELKSPLASIQLSLETLAKRQLNPEQIQKLSNQGLKETARLHGHIQAMLLAARMEDGYEYSFEQLELGSLLKNLVESAQPKFKGQIVLSSDQPEYWIKADKLTLSTAFDNLLENALKYASETEKIEVRIHRKTDTSRLLIEVADTGIGIDRNEWGKIFGKFYRVGNESTRAYKGTGLGLYITKTAIEAHKGKIWVKANQPKGTVFCVELGA